MKTFEEWLRENEDDILNNPDACYGAELAWEHQQKRINKLEEKLSKLEAAEDLESERRYAEREMYENLGM